ncbi:hypothetical protein GCM10009547_25770 [Sporichthya brevicatena]|uniref:Serine O-acetyltransferase n=1 Tax=Sporichthya brevicatena TaxID=171442 RepID=A0ABN1GWH2_9ACTN
MDLKDDLSKATDNFGRVAVILLRLSRSLPSALSVIPDTLLRILCGCDIPRSVAIEAGLRLPHGGRGVVVHPGSRIGRNVTIYHGVTLGVSGPSQGAPEIGDGVYIGTGACLLGAVVVGPSARIGANAVVLGNVPADSTAVGVPARIVSPPNRPRAANATSAPLPDSS